MAKMCHAVKRQERHDENLEVHVIFSLGFTMVLQNTGSCGWGCLHYDVVDETLVKQEFSRYTTLALAG